MPTHTRRVIRTAVRTHNYVHAPIRSAGSLIRKTSFASRSIRRRQRSSFADLNALRGSSPRNASVGARERLAAYRRFMFARNDLLFTMSDNTRMQTTRERDALHARISFHGRATKVGLPSRSSRQLARLSPSGSNAATFASLRERRSGGARRNRTDDLLLAKQALSQLSYGPSRDQISVISNQKILITDI
jgi:hypothetical protein